METKQQKEKKKAHFFKSHPRLTQLEFIKADLKKKKTHKTNKQ